MRRVTRFRLVASAAAAGVGNQVVLGPTGMRLVRVRMRATWRFGPSGVATSASTLTFPAHNLAVPLQTLTVPAVDSVGSGSAAGFDYLAETHQDTTAAYNIAVPQVIAAGSAGFIGIAPVIAADPSVCYAVVQQSGFVLDDGYENPFIADGEMYDVEGQLRAGSADEATSLRCAVRAAGIAGVGLGDVAGELCCALETYWV